MGRYFEIFTKPQSSLYSFTFACIFINLDLSRKNKEFIMGVSLDAEMRADYTVLWVLFLCLELHLELHWAGSHGGPVDMKWGKQELELVKIEWSSLESIITSKLDYGVSCRRGQCPSLLSYTCIWLGINGTEAKDLVVAPT